MREKFGLGSEPIVAVMAGGGADALRLMQTYLEAVHHLQGGTSLATIMVTGRAGPGAGGRGAARRAARL